MINFGLFARPMPAPVQQLPPPNEAQMISDTGDSIIHSMQQAKENARADRRMGLEERQANLADKREGDYMALQNKMEDRRQAQIEKQNQDQRRAQVADLMNKYVNARTEEERAMYRAQLAGMVPGFDRSRGTASPAHSPLAQPAASAAPAQPSPAARRAGADARAMLSEGDAYNQPGSAVAPSAEPPPEPTPSPGRAASAGIIPKQVDRPMAQLPPPEPGPAPTGGGGIPPGTAGPPQDALQGDWQQGYMHPPAYLPGQAPLPGTPAPFLAAYRRAHPEEFGGRPLAADMLSEGDVYLK